MNRYERWFAIWTLSYMVIYALFFVGCAVWCLLISRNRDFAPENHVPGGLSTLFVLHSIGMFQAFALFLLTVRDLFRRSFSSSERVIWLILFFYTGGICWMIYLFKYAFKPLPNIEST